MPDIPPRAFWTVGFKTVAAIASTGAAIVSIATFVHSNATPEARAEAANGNARWIGVRPGADTASAIGDTLHFAATIIDTNGSVIPYARPTWTSENPAVASVGRDGSVIARTPGATTIFAVVGEHSARARVLVRPVVATVRIAGDSTIAMAEGDKRPLQVRADDAHGFAVPGRHAQWTVDHNDVATIDSAGTLTAVAPGRVIVNATVDGIPAQALVTVSPTPTTITIVSGNAQRARAGAALPRPVVVRVTNKTGRPIDGTLVRFRTASGDGALDPAAVVTDADGKARTTWTLADVPGRQQLLASVERIDSAAVVLAESDPIPANTRAVAVRDSLVGVVGRAVEGSVGIRLSDTTGRPFADVPVTWNAENGGTVKALSERTDSLGEVHVQWMLGPRAGAQHARARIGGGHGTSTLVLTAMARAGAPARIVLQRTSAKQDGADPRDVAVAIAVVDAGGNGVAAAATKCMAHSGATVGAIAPTDSSGHTVVVWTLAEKSGDQTITCVVPAAKGVSAALVSHVAPARSSTKRKH